MAMKRLLVFLTLLAVECTSTVLKLGLNDVEQQKPWFCHDLECPHFDLLNKTEAYETRKYQAGNHPMFDTRHQRHTPALATANAVAGRWVSTHSEGNSYQTAVAAGFQARRASALLATTVLYANDYFAHMCRASSNIYLEIMKGGTRSI